MEPNNDFLLLWICATYTSGIDKSKRLKDRDGYLGRISKCTSIDGTDTPSSFRYNVDWVLGGKLAGVEREDLVYRTADEEGMTDIAENRRQKRPPSDFMEDIARMEETKKQMKGQTRSTPPKTQQQKQHLKDPQSNLKVATKTTKKSSHVNNITPSNIVKKVNQKKLKSFSKKIAASSVTKTSKRKSPSNLEQSKSQGNKIKKRKKERSSAKTSEHDFVNEDALVAATSSSLDLYERHKREFQRFFARLKEKVDVYRHFWPGSEYIPPEADEMDIDEAELAIDHNDSRRDEVEKSSYQGVDKKIDNKFTFNTEMDKPINPSTENSDTNSSDHATQHNERLQNCSRQRRPPLSWEMVERRLKKGSYVLDRLYLEEAERFKLFNSYYETLNDQERPKRLYESPRLVLENDSSIEGNSASDSASKIDKACSRVAYPLGVDWDTFRDDIIGMCDAVLARSDMEDDFGQRGSLSHTIKKIKEALDQACEKTRTKQVQEMAAADDRRRFGLCMENHENKEAAMQSWRKTPFPERRYERVSSDAVCSGLSRIDERIARYELKTSLPDSFIGQSYHYNDTSLSEVWMKSVVDETLAITKNEKVVTGESKKKVTSLKDESHQRAATFLKLSNSIGVTRAQVNATMQALLIGVQDRVMTDNNVLHQCELKSSNWKESAQSCPPPSEDELSNQNEASDLFDIVEKPVWGIDCYTRQNICFCLEHELKKEIALAFIEKWLLPAINACPENIAHNIGNAARILEGLPFDDNVGDDDENCQQCEVPSMEEWNRTPLARALMQKIDTSAPPWLKPAANLLRRARESLGPNFFRVHPKGNGSVLLRKNVEANTLVTFYHGELYPSWRWGEKMDAIEITQQRKDLKPYVSFFSVFEMLCFVFVFRKLSLFC